MGPFVRYSPGRMPVRSLPLLALLAASTGAAADDRAEEPERAPMTWGATDAAYTITIPTEGPLRVRLQWRFVAVGSAWMDVPLAGPGLVVDTVTGPATAGSYGLRALLAPGSTTATVTVTGTLDPTGAGAATLAVLPAARQRVTIDAPGLDVTVAGATDGWLAAADTLRLTWKPHVDAVPVVQQPIVSAEASTAVWAEPGALLSRSAVRWRVARGEVARFELDVTGLEEVEVTGPNLARAVREGGRMVLTPRAPVRGTFVVDVRARRAIAADTTGADVPAPAPRPIASRVERYWTVGRAEDGELVPTGGPRAVPARALPEWARGLSDTPPESFWEGDSPLRVRIARFSPLMGPDTVIERAELVVAAAAEGRALVRTTWHTRNERRQYLHVRPPPGLRPMTARVSGEPVSVLSDGAGGVYVPLEKSVETVQGLLTFPVELTWIAEGEAWARKGERTLRLPSVDAPIQAAAWEVYLPRGWTERAGKRRRGKQDEVTTTAPPPPIEPPEAEEALQQAVSAYKSNEFGAAQGYLEAARAMGSTSANVDRLQSNLDVLLGAEGQEAEVEDVATRRVRELANAKTVTMQVQQEKAVDDARRAYESGDVEEAERYLEEVIALADDIGVTEQKESAEQSGKKEAAKELLSKVVELKKRKAPSAPAAPTTITSTTTSTPASDPASGEGEGEGEGEGKDGAFSGIGSLFDGDEEEPPPSMAEDILGEVVLDAGGIGLGGLGAKGRGGGAAGETTSGVQRGTRSEEGRVGRRDDKPAAKPASKPVPEPARPTIKDAEADDNDAFLPAKTPPPAQRAALDVKAAPLTLAMPLGGEVVRSSEALLPADATPTLTLSYRTLPGADR